MKFLYQLFQMFQPEETYRQERNTDQHTDTYEHITYLTVNFNISDLSSALPPDS